MSCWCCGSILVSYREMAGSSPFNDKYFLSLNSSNSVKTFRKNSIGKLRNVIKLKIPVFQCLIQSNLMLVQFDLAWVQSYLAWINSYGLTVIQRVTKVKLCARGVCARGDDCLGDGCVCPAGCLPGGYLPIWVSPQGGCVCPGGCLPRECLPRGCLPLCRQNDRQV